MLSFTAFSSSYIVCSLCTHLACWNIVSSSKIDENAVRWHKSSKFNSPKKNCNIVNTNMHLSNFPNFWKSCSFGQWKKM